MKIITDGSTMQCTLGSTPAKIKVTSQTFSKTGGALLSTEEDKQGMVNIPTFGNCKRVWYQPTCIPNPIKWAKTTMENKIEGMEKLTEQSECPCSFGGKITFTDTGVNSFVETE